MTMPSFNNITWERLEREGAVTYPVDAPDVPGNDIIFSNGFPDGERPREDRTGQHSAAGRSSRIWNTRWFCRRAACWSIGIRAR